MSTTVVVWIVPGVVTAVLQVFLLVALLLCFHEWRRVARAAEQIEARTKGTER